MTAARRLRLVRLRAVAHRLAVADLACADAALGTITALDARVAKLRDAAFPVTGTKWGYELRGVAELAQRLDGARRDLELSRADAENTCRSRAAACRAAHMAQQRADRLHAQAVVREAAAKERRDDARRIWRKRDGGLPC